MVDTSPLPSHIYLRILVPWGHPVAESFINDHGMFDLRLPVRTGTVQRAGSHWNNQPAVHQCFFKAG